VVRVGLKPDAARAVPMVNVVAVDLLEATPPNTTLPKTFPFGPVRANRVE
jgi:hypothetical protein